MTMLLLLMFYQVIDVTFGFQFKCPAPGQWRFRARKIFCLQGYVCLLQSLEKTYQETCDGIDYSSSGSKIVFEPNFNKADCSYQRYQPFPFSTEGNSNCVYQKSICNAEGQTVNMVGSSINDTTCRCEFSKGYRFVNKPKHNCYCIPSQEDCSCHKFDCIDKDNLCPYNGATFQNISCPEIKTKMSQDRNMFFSLKGRFNDASNIVSKGRTNRLYCFYFASALLMVMLIGLPLHGFTGWPAAFYKCLQNQNIEKEDPIFITKTETVKVYCQEDDNMTLLEADKKNSSDMVMFNLCKGANINYKDTRQHIPLSEAAQNGHLNIVKVLVNKDCDKEITDLVGWTPIVLAIREGHLNVVQFLCEQGSNQETRDTNKMTPLLHAAEIGHLSIVKYLVENGSDKTARDFQDGKTALHYAAGNGHLQVTQWLIEKGMDPLEKTSMEGINCIEYYNKRIFEQTSCKDAKTALHLAAENGALEVTKWLIEEAKIDPLVKSSQGMTPYDFAVNKSKNDTEEMKLKKRQVMDFLETVMVEENQDVIPECDSVQQKGSTQNLTQKGVS